MNFAVPKHRVQKIMVIRTQTLATIVFVLLFLASCGGGGSSGGVGSSGNPRDNPDLGSTGDENDGNWNCTLQGRNCDPNTEGEDQSNNSIAAIDPGYPVFLEELAHTQGKFRPQLLPVGNFAYSGKLSIRDSWGNVELGTFDLNVNFAENSGYYGTRQNVRGSFTGKTPSSRLTGSVSGIFQGSGLSGDYSGNGTILFSNNLTDDIRIMGNFYGQHGNDTTGSFKSNSSQPSGGAPGDFSGRFYGDRSGEGS